jgi:hypothetical protein
MQTFIQDFQTVGESTGTLFIVSQQGAVQMSVILNNTGTYPIIYDFQQSVDGVTWSDCAVIGNPLNSTLAAGAQVQVTVASAYQLVRLVGSASGGSTLDFSIARFFSRPSGGYCPLIGGI